MNAIEDSQQFQKQIHLVSTNITKAFDNVQHWAIRDTLSYYNVHPNSIDLIMALYKEPTTFLSTPAGDSDNFPILCGIRQGVAMSAFMCALVTNRILDYIYEKYLGYRFHNNPEVKVNIMAFVDDVVLVSDNYEDIQDMLHDLNKYLASIGLAINRSKSLYTSTSTNNALSLDKNDHSQLLTYISPDTLFRYLGFWYTLTGDWSASTKKAIASAQFKLNKIRSAKILFTLMTQTSLF